MSATPVHDWLRPRIERLLEEAAANDIERSVAVAVLTDIVTDVGFDTGAHLANDVDA